LSQILIVNNTIYDRFTQVSISPLRKSEQRWHNLTQLFEWTRSGFSDSFAHCNVIWKWCHRPRVYFVNTVTISWDSFFHNSKCDSRIDRYVWNPTFSSKNRISRVAIRIPFWWLSDRFPVEPIV
jgi:hypothetical protein